MGGVRIVPDSKKSEVTEITDEIDTDNKGYSDENKTDDEDYMSAKSILSSDDTEPYNEEQMLAENTWTVRSVKEKIKKEVGNRILDERNHLTYGGNSGKVLNPSKTIEEQGIQHGQAVKMTDEDPEHKLDRIRSSGWRKTVR
ncbi:uncharacterized protein RAG0_05721 [Rhynchosporium agropyri]|uniref:Uncharacterized protein n=1 Tax=Rhynchosporium agropyri TaxID=914238 RepID=A0A1E1KE77_9HELO|nr:uncharacterized protein RAG0_05721 [Rhynchosporium agropyri]